jgi:hypothetical protein
VFSASARTPNGGGVVEYNGMMLVEKLGEVVIAVDGVSAAIYDLLDALPRQGEAS